MCAAWPNEGRAGVTGQQMHPRAHKDSFSILNFKNVVKILEFESYVGHTI